MEIKGHSSVWVTDQESMHNEQNLNLYDITVFDTEIAKPEAMQLFDFIKSRSSKMIVLCDEHHIHDKISFFVNGAVRYIDKSVGISEIVRNVEAVLKQSSISEKQFGYYSQTANSN